MMVSFPEKEAVSNGDTVEISEEALEKLAKAGIVATPPTTMTATPFPISYGRFNEGGDYSNSPPVNFLHAPFGESSTKDYFVKNGIINQDYVKQFDSILKDAKGN